MGQYNRRIGGIGLREKTLLVFRMGSAQRSMKIVANT